MQTGVNIVVDANAVHPPEIRDDDPRHIGNLMVTLTKSNAQASADTKYDPKPPPRVDINGNEVTEAFSAELGVNDTKLTDEVLYAIGATALILVVMSILILIDPMTHRIVSQVPHGILFIGLSIGISFVTMCIIAYARYWNDIILWYPQLKR